jgi:hypothetical protein
MNSKLQGLKMLAMIESKTGLSWGGGSTNKKKGNHRKAFFNHEFWFFIEHGLFLVEVFP